jgi:hypothetical protein
MSMRHRRLIAGSLLAALMIATYSSAMAELQSDDEVFTTHAFNIVPENIARVEAISGSGDAIALRVGIGVCSGGPGGPMIIRVHGAPAATFHIGQLIASGVLQVKDHPHAAVRTITAEELRRIGCTFSPRPAAFTLTTTYFEDAPESIYLVLRASPPSEHRAAFRAGLHVRWAKSRGKSSLDSTRYRRPSSGASIRTADVLPSRVQR